MPTTIEETDRHKVKLTVEVPPDRIGKDLDAAYRRVAQQVKVPGFRKGKAPRKVIDAQVGRNAVVAEFLEEAVPVYYREAVREHELAPIADPDIDFGGVEEGKPFVFTATVEIRPRLQLEESDYKGVKVERPPTEVTDREVDELLDRLRERFAELDPVSRPARPGDYVVIDLRATVHGEEVPEASRPDYLYEVGSGEFVEKLDQELEGKRAGEILKFNATLPERFGERAGQEVSFQVLVKEVKAKRLPKADDEFAKTASEFDTLDHSLRAIKADLVLEAVARKEDIQVTAEEIGKEIGLLAASLGRDPKDVARTLERTGQVVTVAGDIIRSKALDSIVEHADIVSEGERRAADHVSDDTEAPSEPPQQDRAEEQ